MRPGTVRKGARRRAEVERHQVRATTHHCAFVRTHARTASLLAIMRVRACVTYAAKSQELGRAASPLLNIPHIILHTRTDTHTHRERERERERETYIHTYMHTHTHMHTHTYTLTHTLTHTHTHTLSLSLSLSLSHTHTHTLSLTHTSCMYDAYDRSLVMRTPWAAGDK